MATPGPWIQPEDIWIEVGRSYLQAAWHRQFNYDTLTGYSVFADRFDTLLHGTSAEFAELNDDAYGRTLWSDGGSAESPSSFRRGYDTPSGAETVASLSAHVRIFRVFCDAPTVYPFTYPDEYPPDYESLEFEGSGDYGLEHRYRVPYFADNQGDASPANQFRVALTTNEASYASGVLDRIPSFDGWTISPGLSEGGGFVDLEVPSESAAISGVPESMLAAGATPTAPDTYPYELIRVGSSTSLTGSPTFTTWRRYTPPRYRFIFPDSAATAGYWTTRQRQTAGGNAGGWPLRQRHNGGHSGSWPLRQRQTGL